MVSKCLSVKNHLAHVCREISRMAQKRHLTVGSYGDVTITASISSGKILNHLLLTKIFSTV